MAISFYDKCNIEILKDLIPESSNVLFIYPKNLEIVNIITKTNKLTCDVMYYQHDDIQRGIDANFNVINCSINGNFIAMESKKYDFVVTDEVLGNARFLGDTVKNIARIGKYGIIGNLNAAHYAKRLHLLFYGSMFVKNPFIKQEDNPWYDKQPWQLSSKDIINICISNDVYIKKGIYYTNSGRIGNAFNLRASPNWSGYKSYFLLTDESHVNIIKNYSFDTV